MNLIEFINTSFLGVRGTQRTDNLHTALVELLISQRPELKDLEVKYEYNYPDSYGGVFKVDVAFLNPDGTCRLILLDKALNSSVGKNIKNYGNTTVGEAARLMYTEQAPAEVLFITVAPRIAPCFTTSGDVKAFDDVVKKVSETNPQRVLDIQYSGKVKVVYIYYDIVDVKVKKHKDEFLTLAHENLYIPCL